MIKNKLVVHLRGLHEEDAEKGALPLLVTCGDDEVYNGPAHVLLKEEWTKICGQSCRTRCD